MNANYVNKTILSNEVHFRRDGLVNRHNNRIFGLENTRMIVQKQIHPNVHCGLGESFPENEAGNALTVGKKRYSYIKSQLFVSHLKDNTPEDMWCQQDDSTYHHILKYCWICKNFS